MSPKIQNHHQAKPAYIYLRQSTMAQVRHHTESTERQYALKDKAAEFGWPETRIRILDADLGVSGAQIAGREDFKILVADVSMGKVGAVFALEASRLARSCADWHRLLELCSLTGTLIIDEDGCYDPADFNDQLLLGLKGTMSQAELHFLRARLQGGKLNKAKKGELRRPLPVGLCYDDEGQTLFDPDEEVRGAVRLLFETFRRTGTAYAVVHRFAEDGMKFPKRAYGGVWGGKLIWGHLCHSRVLGVLRNPAYAGAYVHGRYRYVREISPDGQIRCRTVAVPMSSWQVIIQDHHPGYIGWQTFLDNEAMLERNRTNGEETLLSGPAREGLALLQGLLLCGTCGRRLSVRYKGNGGIYPVYECTWLKREGLACRSCMHLRCDLLDNPVGERVLEVLKPAQIEIALKALQELERQDKAVDRQWQMRLQRAEYEAQLRQRRYEEVDPSNRLVAATLEQRWNQALENLEKLRQEYTERQSSEALAVTPEQRARARQLAHDLPRLWRAPTTKAKDRKRILRLLIKDITVEKLPEPKQIVAHVRWQGGACEDIPLRLPPRACDQTRYPKKMVEEVRGLAKSLPDDLIVATLNQQGRLSATKKPFTVSMIKWIRLRHKIPAPLLKRLEELTVKETAAKFGVSPNVVYYWIERSVIDARKLNNGSPWWITIDRCKERELREWVGNSTKIQNVRARYSQRGL
ncbi:MAG: recombinase family protein [Nitrospirales bacterium]